MTEVLVALIGAGALLGVAWIGVMNKRQHGQSLSKLDEALLDMKDLKNDFRDFKKDYRDRKVIDDGRHSILQDSIGKLQAMVKEKPDN